MKQSHLVTDTLTRVGVQHRYDIDTYAYIQLIHFLKLSPVSTTQPVQ